MLDIHKFYKREAYEALFFGYINAWRFNFPGVTLEQAILNFQKHHQLDEDLMNMESAKSLYNRMAKEYINLQKVK